MTPKDDDVYCPKEYYYDNESSKLTQQLRQYHNNVNNISQFVTGQFQKVWDQEEYPLYTEFVKLYYKWLETRPNTIYYNRGFLS